MLSANRELAQRLERTEGRACREFAMARSGLFPDAGAAWIKCAGAYVVYDGVNSPITQTFGLGIFEEPTPEALDEIERFFFDRGADVMQEVSPLAGIPTIDLLCTRGYRPLELSSVLYQPLPRAQERPVSNHAISVRVTLGDEADLWADTSARGWGADYPELLEPLRQFGALASTREHSTCFMAEIDGHVAAAGALSIHDGVALFGGASTVPEQRHRGLQTALLATRMQYAEEQKCDLAMMVTEAGSQSQRNAERAGFRIAYTRTKWCLARKSETPL